jgi:hypothetical protein
MQRFYPVLIWIVIGLAGCTHLAFQPMREHVFDPASADIKAEDQWIETDDGIALHGWWLPRQGEEKGTILFLHGNAENISTHIGSVWWLPKYGYNVLLIDYRGYGRSEGQPDLPGLQLDMAASLEWIFNRRDIDTNRIVIFGQSLGAATAITGLVDSPYRSRIRALIIEGAFTSYRELTRELLGKSWLTWLFQWPLSLTIDDRYRPIDSIRKLDDIPLLIIHSRNDEIIPYHHGKELYLAAQGNKQFWSIDNARHIATFGDEGQRQRLLTYLRELLNKKRE